MAIIKASKVFGEGAQPGVDYQAIAQELDRQTLAEDPCMTCEWEACLPMEDLAKACADCPYKK